MNDEIKPLPPEVGGYVDEEPNPVIWACGLVENGKQCAERLRLYTGTRPPQFKHAVAYCSTHGVVPYFPNLEEPCAISPMPADRQGFEPPEYAERS